MIKITGIRLDYGKLKKTDRYRVTQNANPIFSWTVLTDSNDLVQQAYKLKVWSDEQTFLETDWINSSSCEAKYNGRPLQSECRLNISVSIKDSAGQCSEEFSEYFFISGLKKYNLNWIAPQEDIKGRSVYFKKDFIKAKPVKKAVLYACGLGYHKLYLNGKELDNAVLDPAHSDYSKTCYYVMLPELEKMLNQDENCISAVIGEGWRRNEGAYLAGIVGREVEFFGIPQLSLILSIEYEDLTTEIISSDESWQCGYGPIIYSHLFDGEIYDANLTVKDWNFYGDKSNTFFYAKPVKSPGGKATVMSLEPIIEQEVYSAKTVTPLKENVCVVDFGQNIAGICALKLPSNMYKGQRIDIEFMEFLDEDASLYMANLRGAKCKDSYIASGDENDLKIWQPQFTYHGFRYAQIHGIGFVDKDDIVAKSLYTDLASESFFTCGSALVNAIQKNIVQTEKANIHSILTDCPQRDERMGWMNDATVRFEETPFNFDIGKIFPKIIDDLLDAQSDDGAITCTAPFVYGGRPADPVSSSFLVAGLQALLHTGNVDVIKKAYDGFVAWEDCLTSHSTDFIVDYSLYGDWASPIYACIDGDKDEDAVHSLYTPGIFMSTGFYYYNAVLLAKFADLIDKQDAVIKYYKLAEDIKKAILDKWWDNDSAVMATGSQGCQSLALWLGIIPGDKCQLAAAHIHEDLVKRNYRFTTGNICTRYLMDTLATYGYIDDAWKIVTSEEYPSFGYMIQHEATTVWERFELKKSQVMNSYNHPMYGAIGYWFYAYIAGVKPLTKGFETMEISPKFPTNLLCAHAKIDTVKGDVVIRWVRRYKKVYLYVTIPFGASATINFAGKTYVVGNGFTQYSADESDVIGK